MSRPYKPTKSASEEWGTPRWLFDQVNRLFKFTLDAAASAENALCDVYYTKEQDGTRQTWFGHVVWCNPPFSADNLRAFASKAIGEARDNLVTSVLLVPAKTDQPWWHRLWDGRHGPDFHALFVPIQGRVKFIGGKHGAPDPSVLVIVRPAINIQRKR